jgi:hypothetical protein
MNRYTFVIQVHPDGISTLENLGTHERIRVSDLDAIGPQINRWLKGLTEGEGAAGASRAGGDGAPISREPAPRSDRPADQAS